MAASQTVPKHSGRAHRKWPISASPWSGASVQTAEDHQDGSVEVIYLNPGSGFWLASSVFLHGTSARVGISNMVSLIPCLVPEIVWPEQLSICLFLHVSGLGFLTAWWCLDSQTSSRVLAFSEVSVPREKVEVASFLRPGPGNWHSVISTVYYPSKLLQSPSRLWRRRCRLHLLVRGMSKRLWLSLVHSVLFLGPRYLGREVCHYISVQRPQNERDVTVWMEISSRPWRNLVEYASLVSVHYIKYLYLEREMLPNSCCLAPSSGFCNGHSCSVNTFFLQFG